MRDYWLYRLVRAAMIIFALVLYMVVTVWFVMHIFGQHPIPLPEWPIILGGFAVLWVGPVMLAVRAIWGQ